MFTAKQTRLIEPKTNTQKTSGTTNAFLNAGMTKAAMMHSANGALKYATTQNEFVDEFGTCSTFKKPRTYAEVSTSMSTQWAKNPLDTVKFAFYLRAITRNVDVIGGRKTETPLRGQGLKNEGIQRMLWLATNHPEAFWANASLYISVASWKDIFQMLSLDLQYHGWNDRRLDWNKFGQLILAGLENPQTSNLVKKYLPQIKANKNCKSLESQADNIIAKWICSLVFGSKESSYNYKQYRKLKTSGNAHEWQKLISQGKALKLDFNTVHGRALSLLVSGKFLKNQGLEGKYENWLASKPVVKYTGFVYELCAGINSGLKKYQVDTINKQFQMLVDTAKKGAKQGTSLIVVRDTSGSMSSPATGTSIACGDVAKSLALFFSEMLPAGHFSNSWIEFNRTATMHTWKGSTVVEKWQNDRSNYIGNTDFMSVIRLFANIKAKGVAESEFPTGILCISDCEFDPAALGKTNVETALRILRQAGFSEEYVSNFQIVLWNLGNSYYGSRRKHFETSSADVKNVFYFSGLDGAVVSFLTGMEGKSDKAPQTAAELFAAAMDQEVLNMIQI